MRKIAVPILCICICLSVLLSCKNEASEKTMAGKPVLSEQEKETAKREISARIVEIIKGAKKLNADSALKPYANDPHFKIVNPDGSVMDYATMKKSQTAAFATMSSLNFGTVREEFSFLTDELVVCTWIGNNEFKLKTGQLFKTDPYVGSMTFRKKDGVWKIVYAHETGNSLEVK